MGTLTLAERILYSTLKLTTFKGDCKEAEGTGFFYQVGLDENKAAPLIITNKHVLNDADKVVARCHVSRDESPSGDHVECEIEINSNFVISHPDPDVDLCAIQFGKAKNEAEAAGTPILFITLSDSNIPGESDWKNFDAIEDVLMTGCPNGLYDETNNLPIVRRGITATPLANKYNGRDEFIIDMACFPGSSGSPVFVLNRNGYVDRRTDSYSVGRGRFFLVGILHAGPTINSVGQITMTKSQHFEFSTMMHLGFVIRSTALRMFDEKIRAKYESGVLAGG
jgi:hypothetical protein